MSFLGKDRFLDPDHCNNLGDEPKICLKNQDLKERELEVLSEYLSDEILERFKQECPEMKPKETFEEFMDRVIQSYEDER